MAEPDDFAEFVNSSSRRLFRAASLLTGGDLATADDLVAEALGRVYLAWPGSGPRTRSPTPGAPW
jgi:DNA-directed RNA polymerase specialized sigma24 family protein